MTLSKANKSAIEFIEKNAKPFVAESKSIIENIRLMSNISIEDLEGAIRKIKSHARVCMHFHPDRLNSENKTVITSLNEHGFYQSQFESKLSNGKLSSGYGGSRDLWENALFGEAYSNRNLPASDRPKYGALDLMFHPDGTSPRFGSCYFVLKTEVTKRSTFSYLDSYRNPKEKGTLEMFENVFSALLNESFERSYALGKNNIRPSELIKYLSANLTEEYPFGLQNEVSGNLDHYIEAQAHGPISLKSDAEIIVADPSFKGTEIENEIIALCHQYQIKLKWHPGFEMKVSDVPKDFRGDSMPSLAEKIAVKGKVNAYLIGLAAKDLKLNPKNWNERGTYEYCLQELKLLWHVLVKFGSSIGDEF